jgi:sterol desaturase/sphingolipid hydroxylase (fatty acid hydroxylase superfamily)
MKTAADIARWAAYPSILGGSLVGLTVLARHVPHGVAIGVTNVAAGVAIIAAERALPYRGRWRESRGDVRTDLAYLLMTFVALFVVTAPIMAACSAAALWFGDRFGGTVWPRQWPVAAQLALGVLLYELGSYAFHRLCHHTWLWRLHSIHHSARRLHGLNAIRSHPIDLFLSVITTSGPLLLLGVDPLVFGQITVLGTVNMWLQHANADMRTGLLDWIFVTPRIHRWHHSQLMVEQQKNLGAILIVWDVVFGSRLAPADREPPEAVGTGHELAGLAYPDTFLAQVVAPFQPALWKAAPAPDAGTLQKVPA